MRTVRNNSKVGFRRPLESIPIISFQSTYHWDGLRHRFCSDMLFRSFLVAIPTRVALTNLSAHTPIQARILQTANAKVMSTIEESTDGVEVYGSIHGHIEVLQAA